MVVSTVGFGNKIKTALKMKGKSKLSFKYMSSWEKMEYVFKGISLICLCYYVWGVKINTDAIRISK